MGQQFKIDYDDLQKFQQKYEIGNFLGAGQYGNVNVLNQIQKTSQNEDLAVKQLNCSRFVRKTQENEIESFKKVQLLPEKYRKRILEVQNVYWDPIKTQIYMIIPRAQCSLHEEINTYIFNNTYYSQKEICFKLSCALEGLFTLETLGMVHRDIKTENLLVIDDGSLKLADLGTAKKLDQQVASLTIAVGTYKFWSPEQIETFLELESKDFYEYIQSPQSFKNFKTNDLYAVGLCFVLATSLQELPKFRTEKNKKTLQTYKEDRKKWLQATFTKMRRENIYSPDLISLLENMVNEDLYQRWSLLEIAQELCKIQGW